MDSRPIPNSGPLDHRHPGGGSASPPIADDPLFVIAHELARLAQDLAGVDPASAAPLPQPSPAARDALIRLGAPGTITRAGRTEFFTAAAGAIMRALLDRARVAHKVARCIDGSGVSPEDMLALEPAFEALRTRDAHLHNVAALRFFGGLTIEQSAAAIEQPVDVVRADWDFARALLLRQLRQSAEGAGPEQAA